MEILAMIILVPFGLLFIAGPIYIIIYNWITWLQEEPEKLIFDSEESIKKEKNRKRNLSIFGIGALILIIYLLRL
jgi:hypothetical protein